MKHQYVALVRDDEGGIYNIMVLVDRPYHESALSKTVSVVPEGHQPVAIAPLGGVFIKVHRQPQYLIRYGSEVRGIS